MTEPKAEPSLSKKVTWRYDPGEHRHKHCWSESRADFRESGSSFIGKCPNTLSKIEAEIILNQAVFEPLEEGQEYPEKLWAVHEGVIYEAVPTEPGKSYHGYPWRGKPGAEKLPRTIKKALSEMAEKNQCSDDFKNWLKQYEK